MTAAAPIVHDASDSETAARIAADLTAPERERPTTGLHVVVLVTAEGNTGFARLVDPASTGNGSQRWLKHARRGASPGGWSELHHPRAEQELGAWRAEHATQLDRLLIGYTKQAWAIEGDAPYVVEFAPVAMPQ